MAGSPARGEFFESRFDGSWAGVLTGEGDDQFLQLNLGIDGRSGNGYAIFPAQSPGESTTTQVFEVTVESAVGNRLRLSFDDTAPLARRRATITFRLRYATDTDTLVGRSSGTLSGTLELAHMDPARPLERLWSGTANADGAAIPVLAWFTEPAAATNRAGSVSLGGSARVGTQTGPITGSRDENRVQAVVGLTSGPVALTLVLNNRGLRLRGTLEQAGSTTPLRLLPAVSNGKPVKFRSATPRSATAGRTTTLTLKGANFAPGAVVHADNGSVVITALEFVSPKQLRATIQPAAGLAAGTTVGLRLVNADGQTVERATAFSVSAPDGAPLTFAADVAPIISLRCADLNCHTSGNAGAGLVLHSPDAYDNLVGTPSTQQPSLLRIEPGNADDSYLVRKIRGGPNISDSRMPRRQAPLTPEQIDTIVNWVNGGALRDGTSLRRND